MTAPIDLAASPFLVLEATPTATAIEIERKAQKLVGLVRMGASSALSYPTPWGQRPRDEQAIRQAVAELRRPERRLYHEALYEGVREASEGGLQGRGAS